MRGYSGGSLSGRLRPWAPVLLVFAVGVVLSLAAYQALADRDRTERSADLEVRVAALVARSRQILEVSLEAASSLAGLFAASREVERDEFASFVGAAIAREPLIHALAWSPREPDGRLRVRYVEPSRPIFGIDLTSLAEQAAVVDAACRAAAPRVSGPSALLGPGSTVLLHVPAWAGGRVPAEARCAALLGMVTLVLRPQAIADAVARDVPAGELEWALVDVRGPELVVLAESAPGAGARVSGGQRRGFGFVDRSWAIAVAPRQAAASLTPVLVLALGVLISTLAAMLAGGANLLSRLRQRVQRAAQLGQYVLDEEIGRGGMGVVYKAHHVLMRRPTALKLLLSGLERPSQAAQFEREVQLTSKLTHPNTIAIYDYGCTDEGVFYYAMELVDGISFHDVILHDGAQPVGRCVHLMRQVLYALREAHGIGLIHRDLTPANLMTSVRGGVADFVKVLDFGLVKEMSREEGGGSDSLEASGRFFGTPGYAAPEVVAGGASDARSDLYAVGAVLFALLTGHPAFQGSGAAAVFLAQKQSAAPRARALRGDVPLVLDDLVARCLARDPAARPSSAQEVLDLFEQAALPAWSAADAERWWRERPAAVRAAAARAHGTRTSHVTRRTIVVAVDPSTRRP